MSAMRDVRGAAGNIMSRQLSIGLSVGRATQLARNTRSPVPVQWRDPKASSLALTALIATPRDIGSYATTAPVIVKSGVALAHHARREIADDQGHHNLWAQKA
jgi:hypothetical protein